MSTSKTARWLDLLAYLLQHRFPVTREEIYSHVAAYRDDEGESLRRKFERDKDELRGLGIDIETVELPSAAGDEPATAYRLRERDLYLPYLEIGEAGAAQQRPYRDLLRIPLAKSEIAHLDRATRRVADLTGSPLAAAAQSARRKLAFDLPLPLESVERLLAHMPSGDAARSLEVVQQAVADHVAVHCRYYAIGRDADEERVIEPYGLFFSWGRWYCVARSRERDAMRVFRLDRMRSAKFLTGIGARFDVPDDFAIRDWVHRAPWELSPREPMRAVVRFGFPEARWVMAQGLGEVVDEVLDDGGAILAFAVRDSGPFLRWLLTFRAAVEIREPSSLAAELRTLRSRVAALYGKARA